MLFVPKNNGFTLVEVLLYIALFGVMFTGIIASTYPLFSGATRLQENIITEGEVAFVWQKLNYAFSHLITDAQTAVIEPTEGETSSVLILERNGTEIYRLHANATTDFCTPPWQCEFLLESWSGAPALPLNAQRVNLTDLSITHHGGSAGAPRHLDISFNANEKPVGPIRFYLNF